MAECWCWRATANSLIALPSWINIHGLIYNLIILTQGWSVSDDRPSNAHLSVNHAHHVLDRRRKKKLIVDMKKVSFFLGSRFNPVSCSLELIYHNICPKRKPLPSIYFWFHFQSSMSSQPPGGTSAGAPVFLPRSKNTHIRLIGGCNWPLCATQTPPSPPTPPPWPRLWGTINSIYVHG